MVVGVAPVALGGRRSDDARGELGMDELAAPWERHAELERDEA